MIALFLLVACLHQAPTSSPELFPSPPPPPAPPELLELPEASPDELPAVVAYLPGRRAPYTDSACLVTRRAVLVPDSKAADMIRAVELGTWWEGYARLEYSVRLADRAMAQDQVDATAMALQAATRSARWTRWGIPVALTTGIALGALAASPLIWNLP